MFTLQAKPICMRLMPAFSGWLCALGGEYITNGHWRNRSLFSLCLWILPFLSLRMLNSPLFKIKYVLLGSASEPVNFLFLSAKWNFLDNGIMFTDNVSSHPFLWGILLSFPWFGSYTPLSFHFVLLSLTLWRPVTLAFLFLNTSVLFWLLHLCICPISA